MIWEALSHHLEFCAGAAAGFGIGFASGLRYFWRALTNG